MPFGRRSPLEALALPGVILAYKYSQFRQRRREAASRRVTERELSALHHKIVSLFVLIRFAMHTEFSSPWAGLESIEVLEWHNRMGILPMAIVSLLLYHFCLFPFSFLLLLLNNQSQQMTKEHTMYTSIHTHTHIVITSKALNTSAVRWMRRKPFELIIVKQNVNVNHCCWYINECSQLRSDVIFHVDVSRDARAGILYFCVVLSSFDVIRSE